MAGDWIKIEHGLLNKPEVMLLADALDISHFEAVGHLIAFWLWVDLNMSPSCPQVKGTKKGLDRVAGRDGFADAMISVGWLDMENDMISIPGYEVHLSKSAKERAKGQKKKASQRSKLSPLEGDKKGTQGGTREEKRREDITLPPSTCKHSEFLDEGVICPEWLKPEFCRWLAFRASRDSRPVDAILQETWVHDLVARGEAKALADIAFSIRKQAKNLIDSNNDFDKQIKTGTGSPRPEGKLSPAERTRKIIEDLKNGSK